MADRDDRTEDDFDRDLERDSQRGRERSTMADLPDEMAGGPAGASPTSQPHVTGDGGHRQHARKGQAQSPAELTPNEPPKHKEGHK